MTSGRRSAQADAAGATLPTVLSLRRQQGASRPATVSGGSLGASARASARSTYSDLNPDGSVNMFHKSLYEGNKGQDPLRVWRPKPNGNAFCRWMQDTVWPPYPGGGARNIT